MRNILFLCCFSLLYNQFIISQDSGTRSTTPFLWEAANIYFLLTDRFYNQNPENDLTLGRTQKTGHLRNFMGGDLAGITRKIKEGYFSKLGVQAIWFTPVVEQIHGATDEGTGNTYAYHGYWTKDWTALDPNFGTMEDLRALVQTAHAHNIRILLDVVINHTGPVTKEDPVFPEAWVRTQPVCTYDSYESTTACTLVANLPDIRTDSDRSVNLPQQLINKWEKEGRLDQELAELNDFFDRTGYPKAPRYYIIKWLTDYIRELGVDGFRVDTVKHTEAFVWKDLKKEAQIAFSQWKQAHPEKVLDNHEFFMVGEVYGYKISNTVTYDFGDKKENYFENGFNSLINFEFKEDAVKPYDSLFRKYDSLLYKEMPGKYVLNYLSSHDDGSPFDQDRKKAIEAANKLLLAPGASQLYYGDETARPLQIEGATGDANLRSFMNWESIVNDLETQKILHHYQKLGQFRKNHPAIGGGRHQTLALDPYIFQRSLDHETGTDRVIIVLDAPEGLKEININHGFKDGTKVRDAYSGQETVVQNSIVKINSSFSIVLLEKI
ncbi:alpha-amylase family glycosyl hydrolase [Ascidiimonas aurantiaca]|uniref:alpha-amylase family glycosyl hydrolase n=1 Tax=Ascidiimonas aurantiaca TaxID=1685432 RepID=UPI0030EDD98B